MVVTMPARARALPAGRLPALLVALMTSAAPPFLVGALAVDIDRDLHMPASEIGVAVGLCYLVAAPICLVVGPWVDRIGAAAALRLTCVCSAVSMTILALAPTSLAITCGLLLQGLPVALSQPMANLMLAGVPADRHRGVYFGLVQSSIPAAVLISGVMLGLVATTWGWRFAFAVVAGVALLGTLFVRGTPQTIEPASTERVLVEEAVGPRWPCLALLGIGGFLGSATATVLPAFAASAAIDGGLDAEVVGAGIVIASLACIACRIVVSGLAGRLEVRRALSVLASLLLCGVVGYVGMAVTSGWTILVSLTLAYALGWGWPGVFNLAVTAARPSAVGTMTGRTQAAMFAGGMAGPVAFGLAADRSGNSAAWVGVGVFAGFGAVCFVLAACLWRGPTEG